jgi:hypothetical protein
LQHIDREEAIKGIWPSGLPNQQIRVKDSIGASRYFSLDENPQLPPPGLEGVWEHSAIVLKLSRKLEAELQKKLTLNKREKAFLKQEQQLIAEVKALEAYVDSLNTGVPESIALSLESLKSFAQEELKTYVNMEENEDKLRYSSRLAQCFKTTKGLANTIHQLPKQEEEIFKLYQDQVWNPFTATVMDEEVKRRITRAYKTVVIPYYLNQVQTALTCDNIDSRIKDFKQLHQRMIELRKEDTKKLERKLNRSKDPEEVLSKLGLNQADE